MYHFLVHFMFDLTEDKLSDDVFYRVILNKCWICIYILSYLYTVTLYSTWLLQIGNSFFVFSIIFLNFGFVLMFQIYNQVTLRDCSWKSVTVLSEENTALHWNKHDKTSFFPYSFFFMSSSLVHIEGDGRAEVYHSIYEAKGRKPWIIIG